MGRLAPWNRVAIPRVGILAGRRLVEVPSLGRRDTVEFRRTADIDAESFVATGALRGAEANRVRVGAAHQGSAQSAAAVGHRSIGIGRQPVESRSS